MHQGHENIWRGDFICAAAVATVTADVVDDTMDAKLRTTGPTHPKQDVGAVYKKFLFFGGAN